MRKTLLTGTLITFLLAPATLKAGPQHNKTGPGVFSHNSVLAENTCGQGSRKQGIGKKPNKQQPSTPSFYEHYKKQLRPNEQILDGLQTPEKDILLTTDRIVFFPKAASRNGFAVSDVSVYFNNADDNSKPSRARTGTVINKTAFAAILDDNTFSVYRIENDEMVRYVTYDLKEELKKENAPGIKMFNDLVYLVLLPTSNIVALVYVDVNGEATHTKKINLNDPLTPNTKIIRTTSGFNIENKGKMPQQVIIPSDWLSSQLH